jgi:hypothetical protein
MDSPNVPSLSFKTHESVLRSRPNATSVASGISASAQDASKAMKPPATHILICSNNSADLEWQLSQVTNLGIWLLEVDTHPSIQKCIMDGLSLRATTTLFSSHADHICLTVAVEQDEIGWQNFVEGKISKTWGIFQWRHYQEQPSM